MNDIKLLTSLAAHVAVQNSYRSEPSELDSLLAFSHENHYYAEFSPQEIDQVNSVGSLCRITGFLNAAARVKILKTISHLRIVDNVVYLDNQNLLLKNAKLSHEDTFSMQKTDKNTSDLGKWQLIAETTGAQPGHSETTSKRQISDWLQLVRAKPINLPPSQGNVLSNLNLLRHFKTFEGLKERELSECGEMPGEPPFEDFVEWLINKDDYSQKSVTQNAQSVSFDVDESAFCEVIDLLSD